MLKVGLEYLVQLTRFLKHWYLTDHINNEHAKMISGAEGNLIENSGKYQYISNSFQQKFYHRVVANSMLQLPSTTGSTQSIPSIPPAAKYHMKLC